MNVLVVGSTGFIGRSLANHCLRAADLAVYTADIGNDVTSERHFLLDAQHPDFVTLLQQRPFDLCVNCTGAASVPASLEQPALDFQLNTRNVFDLLDAIRVVRPECRFLNLSSAAVYGNPRALPIGESHRRAPVSPYGYHKLQAELLCEEFHTQFGLSTCSVRIFSAYGAGLRKQLFWDLGRKAAAGAPVCLWGTGRESRDFIEVGDLARALLLVSRHAPFEGEAVNVANGLQVFIEEAVQVFLKHYPAQVPYEFGQQVRKGDPINWVADITTLRSFGYEPSISLDEGLARYVRWLTEAGS